MADGNRTERDIEGCFNEAGYWTYRPENASYGDNDMWNLFDIGAVSVHVDRKGRLWLIQAKSNGTQGELKRFFENTEPFQAVSGVSVGFAIRYDGHGGPHAKPAAIRLAAATADGYEWVVDERDMDCRMGEGVVEWLGGER